ncbi:MAG: hypothetical protein ABF608_07135 [Sporolactobacillus sp.]
MITTLIVIAITPLVFSAALVAFAWRRGIEKEDRLQRGERENARN